MSSLLLFGLVQGRKIHEFISLAFKRGIDLINDPILSGIINCLQVSNYTQIKRKGRVYLPESANLLGVVDSTGTLAPNEVFIQIKRNDFLTKNQKTDPSIRQILKEMIARQKSTDFKRCENEEEEKKSHEVDSDLSEISFADDDEEDLDLLNFIRNQLDDE